MNLFPAKQPVQQMFRRVVLPVALSCVIGLGGFFTSAHATQLPPGVLNYVHQKDTKAQVRFDGVVIFSNGNTYLPVIPQDTAVNPDPMGVVNIIPEKSDYPDLIQFDNNFFLIKIIQTSSGRLTLPKLATYPIQLKEGLLPQDLVIPNHLFIPDELKIILGELRYSPTLDAASPKVTVAQTIKSADVPKGTVKIPEQNQRILYAYDMDRQVLTSVDVFREKEQSKLSLGCMPASMVTSPDGKYLYAGCLSNNEIVAVDLAANLVKTRVPAGNKPLDLFLLPRVGFLAVSNRYDQVLSLINTKELLPASKDFQVPLPGKPGVIVGINDHEILVADAFLNKIYHIDLAQREIIRTLTSLPDTSAMWLHTPPQGRMELWVVSRSQNKVQILDLANGTPVATLDVGSKPIAIAGLISDAPSGISLNSQMKTIEPKTEAKAAPAEVKSTPAKTLPPLNEISKPQLATLAETPGPAPVISGTRVYVLSSGEDRLDVIDPVNYKLVGSIALPSGFFPTSMSIIPVDQRAYIGGAGKDGIVVVDLNRNQLSDDVSVPFRTFSVTAPLHTSVEATGNEHGLAIIDPTASKSVSADEIDSEKTFEKSGKQNQSTSSDQKPKRRFFAPGNSVNNSSSAPYGASSAVMPTHLSVPTMQQGGIHFSTPNQAAAPLKSVGQWANKKKTKPATNDLQMMEIVPAEEEKKP